jgi:IS30 family transposase
MSHKQLTQEQRYHIYGLWRAGFNQVQIAEEIGVNKSTISREFKRNTRWNGYVPGQAQWFSDNRRKHAHKYVRFISGIQDFVRAKILLDWSPEQISGYAKRHKLFSISHERIYQFILNDKENKGKLYFHLRHQNKIYEKRYGSPKRQGPIKNRKFIEERPKIVDDKNRIGDWEIDTIIGKEHKQSIVTIVERFSKKSVFKKVNAKTAELVTRATIEGLKNYSDLILTITADNGCEFAYHEKISRALNADYYFASIFILGTRFK